jgi:hypothetical protein
VVFVFTPMFFVAWILPMLFVDEVIFPKKDSIK